MTVSNQVAKRQRVAVTDVDAQTMFSQWLQTFGAALESGDIDGLVAQFDAAGYWKDMLAFTGDYPTFHGPEAIRDMLGRTLAKAAVRDVRPAVGRLAPTLVRRSAKDLIEGFFEFDTRNGKCTGFVRLQVNPEHLSSPTVWVCLTALQELRGFEEAINARRPSGEEFSQYKIKENWQQVRDRTRAFADRDPQVLIVGAGHAGLILAARLRLMGVDALVVEKQGRVGDTWRQRYHSLTLHNESVANHMPFIPFPPSWPIWLSKDQLAGWLESYAESMELNVWTNTEVQSSSYDATSKQWTVELQRGGVPRTLKCRHFVMATGVSGSIPIHPQLPGLSEFKGEVLHSAQFSTGAQYKGKRALVIGTGNSGHDVAQDLVVNEAAAVYMLQRSPTCVVSLEPTATSVYRIYREAPSVDDIDLQSAAISYSVLEETYKWMMRRAAVNDRALIEKLNTAGFETYYGDDETGFHMMYLRGEGGYYIDVGCSQMIIDGRIGMLHTRDMERFVKDGLQMKDGTVVPLDLVVTATGFKNMQENIRKLMGDEIADKVGPVWGFDEHNMMRNMWKPTAQENFWIMGGALIDARLFSRYLAIQLTASLNGIEI